MSQPVSPWVLPFIFLCYLTFQVVRLVWFTSGSPPLIRLSHHSTHMRCAASDIRVL